VIQIPGCSEGCWLKYRPAVFIQRSITVIYYYYYYYYYYHHVLLGAVLRLQELIDDIRYITYNTDLPVGGPVTRVIQTISRSG